MFINTNNFKIKIYVLVITSTMLLSGCKIDHTSRTQEVPATIKVPNQITLANQAVIARSVWTIVSMYG